MLFEPAFLVEIDYQNTTNQCADGLVMKKIINPLNIIYMSDQQDLLDLLEEIKAVPDDQIIYCDMPCRVFIDEAESLHTRATEDLPLLSKYNLTGEDLDRLLAFTGALRTAQSNWEQKSTYKQKAMDAWNAEAPAMYELRKELIDHMEFAYRNDDNLLNKLKLIKEGDSRADAIQDLSDLSVLGKEYPAPLAAINYDLTNCDKAAEFANKMGGLLGDINGHMYFEDDLKLIRDKAYTLTKRLVDEIRSYGKFVFRNDSKKIKAYGSKYIRERQSEYRKEQALKAKQNEEQIQN